jgi:hypothetical protein
MRLQDSVPHGLLRDDLDPPQRSPLWIEVLLTVSRRP